MKTAKLTEIAKVRFMLENVRNCHFLGFWVRDPEIPKFPIFRPRGPENPEILEIPGFLGIATFGTKSDGILESRMARSALIFLGEGGQDRIFEIRGPETPNIAEFWNSGIWDRNRRFHPRMQNRRKSRPGDIFIKVAGRPRFHAARVTGETQIRVSDPISEIWDPPDPISDLSSPKRLSWQPCQDSV